ncbi:iron-containing alcohol dehydrogenase [Caballeronia cordobensis]|uniref:iron-containing alcohol dehydrogenase n=1 Tax=Caballeronia cordobensis TaxID=1353886 RepID=UPI00045EFC89|nr:lactaldehyde reductase [Burkholderia sp. RPE67]
MELARTGTHGQFIRPAVDEVRFGAGCIDQLAQLLERDGIRRAVVVTGKTLANTPALLDAVISATGGRCAGVFCETQPHVPRETAIAAAECMREKAADAVISFGGSTQSDTAKGAVWALADDLRAAADFEPCAIRFDYPSTRIVPSMQGVALPIYAVPTTLSAGEFSDIAGLSNTARGEKDLYRDRKLGARAVLLDPELTLNTPEWLWLSSGIKAVDHCVEAWFSITAQPMVDALAIEGLAALMRWLPITRRNPEDLEARMHCQIAAWLSVSGLANVSLGLSHGLGHQLGGRCKVAHGHTSCVLLPQVVRFNAEATTERRALLCRRLEAMLEQPFEAGAFEDALRVLIVDELGLPSRLRDLSVAREDLPFVARAALRDPIVATNPRPIRSADEVMAVLDAAW